MPISPKQYQKVNCKNCYKSFIRMYKGKRIGSLNARSYNCLTCSKKCSNGWAKRLRSKRLLAKFNNRKT